MCTARSLMFTSSTRAASTLTSVSLGQASVGYRKSDLFPHSERLHPQARHVAQPRDGPHPEAARREEEATTSVHRLHPRLQGCSHLRLPSRLQGLPQDLPRQSAPQASPLGGASQRSHHEHQVRPLRGSHSLPPSVHARRQSLRLGMGRSLCRLSLSQSAPRFVLGRALLRQRIADASH